MKLFIVILNILLFFEPYVSAGGIGFLAESELSLPNFRQEVNTPVGFYGVEIGGASSSRVNQDFGGNGGSRFETSFSSRSSANDGDQIKANAEIAGKNFVNAIKDGIGGIVSAIGNSFGGKSKSSGVEISYASASNRNNARNKANTDVELNFNGRSEPSRASNVGAYSNTDFRTDSRTNVGLNFPTRVNTNFNGNFRTEPKTNVEVNFNNRNSPSRVSASANNNFQRNPTRTNTNVEVNFSNRNNAPGVNNNYNNFRAESVANGKANVVVLNNRNNNPSRVSQTNYNFQTNPARANTNVEVNFPARVSTNFNSNFRTEPKGHVEVNFNKQKTRVSTNTNFQSNPARGNSNVQVNFNNRINPSRVSANSNSNIRVNPTTGNSKTNFELSFTNRNDGGRVNSNSNSNFKSKGVAIGSGVGFGLNIGSRHQGNLQTTTQQKQSPSVELSFNDRNDPGRLTVDSHSSFNTKSVSSGNIRPEPIVNVQVKEDFPENSREVALNSFGKINWSDENEGYSKSTIDVLKKRYDDTDSGVNVGGGLGSGSSRRSQFIASTAIGVPITSGRVSVGTGGSNKVSSGTGRLSTDQIFKSSGERSVGFSNRNSGDSAVKFGTGGRGRIENSRESVGNLGLRSSGRISLGIRNDEREVFNVGSKSDSSRSSSGGTRFSLRGNEDSGNLGLNVKKNVEHRIISTSSNSKSSDPIRLSGGVRFQTTEDNFPKRITERRIITTRSKLKSELESDPSLSGRFNIRAGNSRDKVERTSNSRKTVSTGGGYGNLDFSAETITGFGSDSLISTGGGKFIDDKDSRELHGDIFVGTSSRTSRLKTNGGKDLNFGSKSEINAKVSSAEVIGIGGRFRDDVTEKDSRELRGDIFVGNSGRTKNPDRIGELDFKSNLRSETTGRDQFRSSDRDRDEFRGRHSADAKFITDIKTNIKTSDIFADIKGKSTGGGGRVELGSRHSSSFRPAGNIGDSLEVKEDITRTISTQRFSTDTKGRFGDIGGSNFRSDIRTEFKQPLTEIGIRSNIRTRNSGELSRRPDSEKFSGSSTLSARGKSFRTSEQRDNSKEVLSLEGKTRSGGISTDLGFQSESPLRRTSTSGIANSRFRSNGRDSGEEKVPFGEPLINSREISIGADVKSSPKVRFSYRR